MVGLVWWWDLAANPFPLVACENCYANQTRLMPSRSRWRTKKGKKGRLEVSKQGRQFRSKLGFEDWAGVWNLWLKWILVKSELFQVTSVAWTTYRTRSWRPPWGLRAGLGSLKSWCNARTSSWVPSRACSSSGSTWRMMGKNYLN